MDAVIDKEFESIKRGLTAMPDFNAVSVADGMLEQRRIVFAANNFYEYEMGVYKRLNEGKVRKQIKGILKTEFTSHRANEVISALGAETYVDLEELNKTSLLNLRNGLFDLNTYELIPHDPGLNLTIQLNVRYFPDAQCPKWKKALLEIFENDINKVGLLQEFFGLCLTKETKHEKALFCLGQGANGKSVTLYVLQKMLGDDNTSAIPLERFDSGHYTAHLFSKLANIAIETNAKSSVYDSTFKAIISGDEISADEKFQKVIKFRPFCKLVFALNNMPRVDDKTSAFFRRLLILKFNREFSETEQNKNLKHELVGNELDGIFNWSLQGLRRLRERGYFDITQEIRDEVKAYQKENNNVLLFIDEICVLDPELHISKDDLYRRYVDWCRDNGCRSLSKNKFGKELPKHFPTVESERLAHERRWQGIGWQ